MRANCRAEVERTINRPLAPGEAEFIEDRILRQLRKNARDRASWRALKPAQRIQRAGALAAQELDADREIEPYEWSDEDLLTLQGRIEAEAAKAGIPINAIIEPTLDRDGQAAVYGSYQPGRNSPLLSVIAISFEVAAGSTSINNALRNMQGILTHEFLHWAKEKNVIKPEQWAKLVEAASRLRISKNSAKGWGEEGLNVWQSLKDKNGRAPTYKEFAEVAYPQSAPDVVTEESVAILLDMQRKSMVEEEGVPGDTVARQTLGAIVKFIRAVVRAVRSLTQPQQEALRNYTARFESALRSGKLVKQSLDPFKVKLRESKFKVADISDKVLSKYGDYIDSLSEAIATGDIASILTHPIWAQYERNHKGTPTFGTNDPGTFLKSRRFKNKSYVDAKGNTLSGPELVQRLVNRAKAHGSNKKRKKGVAYATRATIVTGSPGSTKTTMGKTLAKTSRAAFIQTDDIMPYIPEYKGGAGYYDVNAEAEILAGLVMKEIMLDEGPNGEFANLIIEQTGNDPESLSALITHLAAEGYDVDVVHVESRFSERVINVANRFLSTGRWVRAADQIEHIGNKPTANHGFVEEMASNGHIKSATRVRYSQGKYSLVAKIGKASPGTARAIRSKTGWGLTRTTAKAVSTARQLASDQIVERMMVLAGYRGNINQESRASWAKKNSDKIVDEATDKAYEGKDAREALDWLATEELVYQAALRGDEDLFPLIAEGTERPNLNGSAEERARAYARAYLSEPERMARAKAEGYRIPASRAILQPYSAEKRGRDGVEFYALNNGLAETYIEIPEGAPRAFYKSKYYEGGNVMPALLKAGNSLKVEGRGKDWDAIPFDAVPWKVFQAAMDAGFKYWRESALTNTDNSPEAIAKAEAFAKSQMDRHREKGTLNTNLIAHGAKNLGYDSVVFLQIRDSMREDRDPETVYAILNKDNAKSVFNAFGPGFSSGDFSRSPGGTQAPRPAPAPAEAAPDTPNIPPSTYRTPPEFKGFWKIVRKYPALKNAAFNSGVNLRQRTNGDYVSEQQLHKVISVANSMPMESDEWRADLAALQAYVGMARHGGAEPNGNFFMMENIRTGKLRAIQRSDGKPILINPSYKQIQTLLNQPEAMHNIITVKDSDGNVYVSTQNLSNLQQIERLISEKQKELEAVQSQKDVGIEPSRRAFLQGAGAVAGVAGVGLPQIPTSATATTLAPNVEDALQALQTIVAWSNPETSYVLNLSDLSPPQWLLDYANQATFSESFIQNTSMRYSFPKDSDAVKWETETPENIEYQFIRRALSDEKDPELFAELRALERSLMATRRASYDKDMPLEELEASQFSNERLMSLARKIAPQMPKVRKHFAVSTLRNYISELEAKARSLVNQERRAKEAKQEERPVEQNVPSQHEALVQELRAQGIPVHGYSEASNGTFTNTESLEFAETFHYIFPKNARPQEEYIDAFAKIFGKENVEAAIKTGRLNLVGSVNDIQLTDGDFALEYLTEKYGTIDSRKLLRSEMAHRRLDMLDDADSARTYYGFTGAGGRAMAVEFIEAKDVAIVNFGGLDMDRAKIDTDLRGKGTKDEITSLENLTETLGVVMSAMEQYVNKPGLGGGRKTKALAFQPASDKHHKLYKALFNLIKAGRIELSPAWETRTVGQTFVLIRKGLDNDAQYKIAEEVMYPSSFIFPGRESAKQTNETLDIFRQIGIEFDSNPFDDPDWARMAAADGAMNVTGTPVGFSSRDGRVYVFTDAASPDDAVAVLFHELGHVAFEELPNFDKIMESFGKLVKAGDPDAVRGYKMAQELEPEAKARADAGDQKAKTKIRREALAYALQGVNMESLAPSWWNTLMELYNGFRLWLGKKFPGTLENLSFNNLKYMALGAGKRGLKTAPGVLRRENFFYPQPLGGTDLEGDFARAPRPAGAAPPSGGATPPPAGGTSPGAAPGAPPKRWKYGNKADAQWKAQRAANEVANLNRKSFSPFMGLWAEQIPNYRPLRRNITDVIDGFDKDLQEWNRAKLAKIVNLMPGIRDIIKRYLPFAGIPDAIIQNVLQAYATGDAQSAQDKARTAAEAVAKAIEKDAAVIFKAGPGGKAFGSYTFGTKFTTVAEVEAGLNQAAYEAMIENDPVLRMQKINALPPALSAAVRLARNTINDVSDAMLHAGLISMETYENHFGHYLRRSFTKYIDQYRPSIGFRASGAPYTKQRQELSSDTKITMGEIKDLPMLVYMSIQQPLHDITVYDYWNSVMHHSANSPTNPGWVLPKSMAKWNGKTVSLWWLANEELPQIQEMLRIKNTDLRNMRGNLGFGKVNPTSSYASELRREIGVLSQNMLRIQRLINANPAYAQAMAKGDLPDGYKQLPGDPSKFGSAAGAVVLEDFYNQAQPSAMEQLENRDDFLGFTTRVLSGANRSLKFLLTVANPVTHARNIYTNIITLPKHGINVGHVIPAIMQLRDYHKNNVVTPLIKALQETGLLGAAWTEQELRVMDTFVAKVKRASDRATTAENVKRALSGMNIQGKAITTGVELSLEAVNIGRMFVEAIQDTYGKGMSEAYQFADVVFKAAVMNDRLSRGVPAGVASLEATRLFFDYSRVIPAVRFLRDAPLGNTFISYNYFALPVVMDSFLTAPWRLLYTPSSISMGLFGYFILTAMLGYDDDDLRQLFSADAGKNNWGLVGVPLRDEFGRTGLVDAALIDPSFMYLNAAAQLATPNGVLGALGTLGFGGVMGNMGLGYFTGMDPRFGTRIWEEYDTPEVRNAKRNAWMARQLIPSTYSNWLPPFGPQDTGGASYEAIFGTGVDQRGQPTQGPGDIALRTLGFNVRRVDVFYEYAKRQREYEWRLQQIEADINRTGRNQRLTPERRQAAMERRREEHRAIIEERNEFNRRVAELLAEEEQNLYGR